MTQQQNLCVCVCVLDQTLEQQGVKNHSKMMVLKLSDGEWKELSDEKQNQQESVQRTQKGFQILSERGETAESCWL